MNFCRAYILTVSSDSKLLSVEFVEFKVDLFITSCFPYLYHLSTTQNPVLLSPSFPLERACSVSKSCPVMSDSCDPMDCTPPGSYVHGIFQARILELPFPSSGDLPNPGIKPASPVSPSPALAGRFLTTAPPWKPTLTPRDPINNDWYYCASHLFPDRESETQ